MDDLFGNNNNNNNNTGGEPYGNNGYGNAGGNDSNGAAGSSNNGYGSGNDYYGGYGSRKDNYKRDNFGLYNDSSYNMYPQSPQSMKPEKKGFGFALTALIVAVINLIICKSIISIITVPLCLVFAIISLAGKRKGKAMAIISIVLSVVSAVIFGFYMYIGIKIMPDMVYFIENSETITEEFEKDGTIPERFEKYREPKFDRYWKKSGYDDFDGFFKDFIRSYKDGYSYGYNFASGGSSFDSSPNSGGQANLALIG